jgi:hypothetical protein
MEPESSLLFGIASQLFSPPTRVAHHDEIGGRTDPLHNAIDLIGFIGFSAASAALQRPLKCPAGRWPRFSITPM